MKFKIIIDLAQVEKLFQLGLIITFLVLTLDSKYLEVTVPLFKLGIKTRIRNHALIRLFL